MMHSHPRRIQLGLHYHPLLDVLPSMDPFVYVPIMTASSQNHEFYLIFAKQYTISDTLKSMFEYVAKHQAQGDVVQFFWVNPSHVLIMTPFSCTYFKGSDPIEVRRHR